MRVLVLSETPTITPDTPQAGLRASNDFFQSESTILPNVTVNEHILDFWFPEEWWTETWQGAFGQQVNQSLTQSGFTVESLLLRRNEYALMTIGILPEQQFLVNTPGWPLLESILTNETRHLTPPIEHCLRSP